MSTLKDKTEIGSMWSERVSVTKVNGRLIVTNRPQRKSIEPSDKQLEITQKFTEANLYAKGQMAIPAMAELYATGINAKSKSAFAVAMRDYLVAPEVQLIDTNTYNGAVGSVIEIKATDDFQVIRVVVTISDASGAKLEQGEAVQDATIIFNWTYAATVANANLPGTKIEVVAFDRAGNQGLLEKVIVVG